MLIALGSSGGVGMHALLGLLLLGAGAAGRLRGCAQYCASTETNHEDTSRLLECGCLSKDHSTSKERAQSNRRKPVPTHSDSSIFYEPAEYSHVSPISFAENPFYIVNPTFHKRSKTREENHDRNVRKIINANKINKFKSESEKYRVTKSIIPKISQELEGIPLYLDIDISEEYSKDRSSEKNGAINYDLSENDLIECIDLYIYFFSRTSGMDKDILDENQMKKYENLSDSDLMVQIQNKCHHPFRIVKDSLDEITTARPRKPKIRSSTADHDENLQPHFKSAKFNHEASKVNDINTADTRMVTEVSAFSPNASNTARFTKAENDNNVGRRNEIEISNRHIVTSEAPHADYSDVVTKLAQDISTTVAVEPTTSTNILTELFYDAGRHGKEKDFVTTEGNLFSDLTSDITNNTTVRYSSNDNSNDKLSLNNFTMHENFEKIISTKLDANLDKYSYESTTWNYLSSHYANTQNKIIETTNKNTPQSNELNPTTNTIIIKKSQEFETTALTPSLINVFDKLNSSLDSSTGESNQYKIKQNPSSGIPTYPTFKTNEGSYSSDIGHITESTTTWNTIRPHQYYSTPHTINETDITYKTYLINSINDLTAESFSDGKNKTSQISNMTHVTNNFQINNHTEKDSPLRSKQNLGIEDQTVAVSTRKHSEDPNYAAVTKLDSPLPIMESTTQLPTLIDIYSGNYTHPTTDNFLNEQLTTESIKKFTKHSANTKYKGRKDLSEKEIKIPKIVTKEYSNDTVVSDVVGTETIPNNDFIEYLPNSELPLSFDITTISSTLVQSKLPSSSVNLSTRRDEDEDITGELYFIFDKMQIPARFVQNTDGQIKLGIDGKSLCEKLLQNHQTDSIIMTALCKCSITDNCIKPQNDVN